MTKKIHKLNIFFSIIFLLASGATSICNNSINSIEFLNTKTGLFCCDNGLIYKTINSGKSWYNVKSGTGENLTRIFTALKSNIMIVGSGGTILKSDNSGEAWIKIDAGVSENLNGVFINSNGTGFITGDNGLILQTADFGYSWEIISVACPGSINDVSMFGLNNGIIVGDSNFVIRTTDGGNSWNFPSTIFQSRTDLKHVRMTDSLTAYASSQTGEIFETTNGGNSWIFLYHDHFRLALSKITSINRKTIAAVGGNGDMVFSFDYGKSWNSENSGTTEKLQCMYFTDNNTGYSGGDNGTLIRTTDGGFNWTGISGNPFNSPGKLTGNTNTVSNFSNFPNPFNPSTVISYELSFDANVNVKVFDMLGREVSTLVNSFQKAGNYRSVFNASDLAAGIYFYRISAEASDQRVTKTMKMILVK